ncbi:MAG TPA: hypothetical protein VGO11_19600 [Chthoniobacteraceae bacterium]|jgi:hypothetical protein|nr:hypothetical protein [Chthoniobacteraceae bacterium]
MDRDALNLRAMLEPDIAPELTSFLAGVRPFTAVTLALMQQTRNEWLKRVPVEEMESHYFATLSWLYLQSAPEADLCLTVFNETRFRKAVMEWGVTIDAKQLAAADAIIRHTLALVTAARVAIEPKPDDAPGKNDPVPPPNS